jgi:hypothetical protein
MMIEPKKISSVSEMEEVCKKCPYFENDYSENDYSKKTD